MEFAEGEILDQLQELIKKLIPESFTGKVQSVDESKGIVTVLFDELEYDVKLKSIVDEAETGVFYIPEVDSDVFCVPEGLDKERYFVAGINKVAKIIFKMQNLSLVMDNETETLKINDGSNGGLIVIADLVSRINDLENDINTLKQAFFSWVTVPNDGGAALKTAASTWAGQQFVNTQVADIENDKVKH